MREDDLRLGHSQPSCKKQGLWVITVALQQLLSAPVGMCQKVLGYVWLQVQRLLHLPHRLRHQSFYLLGTHGATCRQLQRCQGQHSFRAEGERSTVFTYLQTPTGPQIPT